MESDLYIYILILFALVLLNAFFAMSEMAIISLNDGKTRKLAAGGDKNATILVKITDKPSDFLATIQVGVTLSGFLASAVAADTFVGYIVEAVVDAGWNVSQTGVRIAALAVVTFVLSFITLVFGELVPKRIAMLYYERISFAVARPLRFLYKIEKPFVALLSSSTNLVLRIFGMDPGHKSETVTEEEIRMMIDVGQESGSIEQGDKDMINNIFEFDDRSVDEMMTHRTEITALEAGASLDEAVKTAIESGYSRIPVYEDDLDTIVGILYVRELLRFINPENADSFDIRAHMRAPFYVPESTSGKTLLKEFKEKKIQMAIIVDEYGGTSGLVTMEDLIESIVGNIQDEYDDEEEEISVLSENRFIIDGLAPVDGVAKYFGIEIEDEDEFDTIGGYIVNRLGFIPGEEEYPSVGVGGILFTVREMDEHRISKIEAERTPA